MDVTALILAMAVVTFAYRYAPLAVLERLTLPGWAYDWLDLVPAAVLAAMLCQAVAPTDAAASWASPYLWAAPPTALVAWRSKSMILTMATGMLSFALLAHLMG